MKTRLRQLLLLLLVCVLPLLAACGNKGPLVHPDRAAASAGLVR